MFLIGSVPPPPPVTTTATVSDRGHVPTTTTTLTSAPRRLAERRIAAAGLPMPRVLVTGDDVEHGKPAPDPFVLGARQLGLPVSRCLVFEDAPAGVEAAEAAGAPVVVITATHPTDINTGHAKIADYRYTKVLVDGDGHMGVRLT